MLDHADPKADRWTLSGPGGMLAVPANDEVILKLAMLYEGECGGGGPLAAAAKFGFSKQRYFQLRHLLQSGGAQALQSRKTGPKRAHRRTPHVQEEVIRHRFLDPEASPAVVAQKIRQTGLSISTRSVQRIIAQFGLQKKTLRPAPQNRPGSTRANPAHRAGSAAGSRRSSKPRTGRPPTPGR